MLQITLSLSSDNVDEVRAAIEAKFGYDVDGKSISGILNITTWKPMFTFFYITLPIIPIYVGVLTLRRAIASKLRKMETISERTKQLHTQLLKVTSSLSTFARSG